MALFLIGNLEKLGDYCEKQQIKVMVKQHINSGVAFTVIVNTPGLYLALSKRCRLSGRDFQHLLIRKMTMRPNHQQLIQLGNQEPAHLEERYVYRSLYLSFSYSSELRILFSLGLVYCAKFLHHIINT